MAELTIQEALWNDLVAVAQRKRTPPQELAERVLRDYLQCVSDEELIARSERAARRVRFRSADAEKNVRQYRRRRT